jgi:hypothetical protein
MKHTLSDIRTQSEHDRDSMSSGSWIIAVMLLMGVVGLGEALSKP